MNFFSRPWTHYLLAPLNHYLCFHVPVQWNDSDKKGHTRFFKNWCWKYNVFISIIINLLFWVHKYVLSHYIQYTMMEILILNVALIISVKWSIKVSLISWQSFLSAVFYKNLGSGYCPLFQRLKNQHSRYSYNAQYFYTF